MAGALAVLCTDAKVGVAEVWSLSKGEVLHRLDGVHGAALCACALATGASAETALCVTACSDGSAALWDAASGVLQGTLRGHHESAVLAAALPEKGDLVVTACRDRTAAVWDNHAEGVRTAMAHLAAAMAAPMEEEPTGCSAQAAARREGLAEAIAEEVRAAGAIAAC